MSQVSWKSSSMVDVKNAKWSMKICSQSYPILHYYIQLKNVSDRSRSGWTVLLILADLVFANSLCLPPCKFTLILTSPGNQTFAYAVTNIGQHIQRFFFFVPPPKLSCIFRGQTLSTSGESHSAYRKVECFHQGSSDSHRRGKRIHIQGLDTYKDSAFQRRVDKGGSVEECARGSDPWVRSWMPGRGGQLARRLKEAPGRDSRQADRSLLKSRREKFTERILQRPAFLPASYMSKSRR